METLDIEKFDPTVGELNRLVSISKQIVEIDIENKQQIETVKKARIDLKNARVAITKKGKELREEALRFQRAFITKQKELIEIIEPEEERLQAIETEAKEKEAKKIRLEEMPYRLEELSKIKDNVVISNEELLNMDNEQFFAYRNQRISAKNEADRLALEEKERKIKEEEERQQRERETQEREKKAREEAQAEAERQLEITKKEAERQKKEEQEKLEKQKKYQTWLEKNEYNESTDKIINSESEIILYRKVSTFKK